MDGRILLRRAQRAVLTQSQEENGDGNNMNVDSVVLPPLSPREAEVDDQSDAGHDNRSSRSCDGLASDFGRIRMVQPLTQIRKL